MLRKYKFAFSAALNKYIAFRGRGFSFQFFTLITIVVSVLVIATGIYQQLAPKSKQTYPAEITAFELQKIK
jgi:hypothetical protein